MTPHDPKYPMPSGACVLHSVQQWLHPAVRFSASSAYARSNGRVAGLEAELQRPYSTGLSPWATAGNGSRWPVEISHLFLSGPLFHCGPSRKFHRK